MTRKELEKALRPAGWIALTGALSCLLFCMIIYGSNWVEKLMPLELAVIFSGTAFVLARVPAFRRRTWLRLLVGVAIIAAVSVLLKILF